MFDIGTGTMLVRSKVSQEINALDNNTQVVGVFCMKLVVHVVPLIL